MSLNTCLSLGVWAIINEDITKRSFCFLKISWHDSRAIFVKYAFGNDIDLFSISKSHVLSIRLISVLNFSFGNIFCGRSITLAFLCRPWANRRETRELSVAWAIRSSITNTLLNFGSISRKSSLNSERPRINWISFPIDDCITLYLSCHWL